MTDNEKLIKKSDVILLVVVLTMALFAAIYIMSTKEKGTKLRISVDGEVMEEFYLSEDREHQITTDKGGNLVVIEDGEVDVIEADCPDKVCVNHVPVDDVGETIICLPHKLVLEIVE